MTSNCAVALPVIVACICLLAAPAPAQPPPQAEVDLEWGVRIPMRDGVELAATLYRPAEMKEPLPVIFTMTPYIADRYHRTAMYFAARGYVVPLVDNRGRGNSAGQFRYFVDDARDGHDVVEWLAQQPWCNGKVAMYGGSYSGTNQWQTLKEAPPHLVTILPVAAAHSATDAPIHHNIFTAYEMRWLAVVAGTTPNDKLFEDDSFWIGKFTKLYAQHLPFSALDRVVGITDTIFQDVLRHPTPDAYWDAQVPTAAQYQAMRVPILTMTGYFDCEQPGALEYYRRHMVHGSPEAKQNHYLIIGPWDHAGIPEAREVGGLKFDEACVLHEKELECAWYDWTLKGGPKPEFLKDRVAYYVPGPGAECWKYAGSLEAISKETRTLYLHSRDGQADDVFASGKLTEATPGGEQPDNYTYDPLDTRPTKLPFIDQIYGPNFVDQSGVMSLRGRGLIYHSEPFAEATEITGFLKLELWIELDVPDTDFWVDVYEILPSGDSVWLTSDGKRARYRESDRVAKLVTPGQIERYVFDSFTFFSRRISKDSRLRLTITCPNTPYLEKNYNAGGVVAEESGKDARTAHVKVYHDAEHPSCLAMPVVR